MHYHHFREIPENYQVCPSPSGFAFMSPAIAGILWVNCPDAADAQCRVYLPTFGLNLW